MTRIEEIEARAKEATSVFKEYGIRDVKFLGEAIYDIPYLLERLKNAEEALEGAHIDPFPARNYFEKYKEEDSDDEDL